jgi:transmembrane sensor
MKTSNGDMESEGRTVAEQAAWWFVTLRGESCTAAEQRAFAEWIARSPERVAAYLRVVRSMDALSNGNIRWPQQPVDSLIKAAIANRTDVARLHSEPECADLARDRGQPRSRRVWLLPAAAVATLLIIAMPLWFATHVKTEYETTLGELHSVVLQDGSVVTLNTSSSMQVDLRKDRRTVRLNKGEALFQVARDAARPFDVVAGTTTIRAVGTQFNVDRRPSRITVSVVEGRVKVSTRAVARSQVSSSDMLLAANERLVILGDTLGKPGPIGNVPSVTAWTKRQLIFEQRPLAEVAEEFNRYNRHRIRISGAELRKQVVTGVFQANDSSSFLAFLAGIPGVRIERSADGDFIVTVSDGNTDTARGPNPGNSPLRQR